MSNLNEYLDLSPATQRIHMKYGLEMVSCPGIPGRILTPMGLRIPIPGRIPIPIPGITNPMLLGGIPTPELARLMELMAMVLGCLLREFMRAEDTGAGFCSGASWASSSWLVWEQVAMWEGQCAC